MLSVVGELRQRRKSTGRGFLLNSQKVDSIRVIRELRLAARRIEDIRRVSLRVIADFGQLRGAVIEHAADARGQIKGADRPCADAGSLVGVGQPYAILKRILIAF